MPVLSSETASLTIYWSFSFRYSDYDGLISVFYVSALDLEIAPVGVIISVNGVPTLSRKSRS